MLAWSGANGLLVEVPIMVYRVSTPVGSPSWLVGGDIQVVGVGRNPESAMAHALARGPQLRIPVDDDKVLDEMGSHYAWITGQGQGFVVSVYPHWKMNRMGIALLARDDLRKALADQRERENLMGVAKAAETAAKDAAEAKKWRAVEEEMAKTVQALDQINKDMAQALEAAQKTSAKILFVRTFSALSVAALIVHAQSGLDASWRQELSTAKTHAELESKLGALEGQQRQQLETFRLGQGRVCQRYTEIRERIVDEAQAPKGLFTR